LPHALAQKPSIKLNPPRNLAGYYATPGTFSLTSNTSSYVQNSPGVYVNVYFADLETGSGNLDFEQKQGVMMLGLYTDQSALIVEECQKFKTYDCSQFECTELPVVPEEPVTYTYPDFQITNGNKANTKLFIDKNYWNLNTSLIFARDCEPFKSSVTGYGTYGILGMGAKGESLKNFATTLTFDSIMGGSETFHHDQPPVFSIFLNQEGTSGDLIFDNDAINKAAKEVPAIVLKASPNWIVEGVTEIEVGNDKNIDMDTSLIFDINSNALGFPLDVYKEVLDAIDDAMGEDFSCDSNVNYRPECKYKGDLNLLPTIKINIGNQTLEVPGSVYGETIKVLDLPSDKIILNLRGISSQNKEYAFVTEAFEKYIILDQHVMGYYYTVFDTAGLNVTNYTNIRVYRAFHGSSSMALTIILVCTVIGLIVGLSIYRYRTIKKAQRMAARSVYGPNGPNYVELDPMPQNRLS